MLAAVPAMKVVIKPKIEQVGRLQVVRLHKVRVDWTDGAYLASNPHIVPAVSNYPAPPGKKGLVEFSDFTLVGMGGIWETKEGIRIVKRLGLPGVELQQLLAIGDVFPRLHSQLESEFLEAVCILGHQFRGKFQSPSMWWSDYDGPVAGMVPFSDFRRSYAYLALVGEL